jgi:uncharacterized protein YjbI with pentapeptide repeats
MATEEHWSDLREQHLSILKQEDVQLWNRWRFQHNRKIYLAGADLSGLHFKPINHQVIVPNEELGDDIWGRLDLSNGYLEGASLRNSSIPVAVLMGTNLRGADLTSAYLFGSFLNGAILSNAILSYTDLRGVEADEASLDESKFYRTKLSGNTSFVEADFTRAKFADCDVHGSFTRAKLIRTSFVGCKIHAGFSDAILRDTEFIECDMSNSVFEGTLLCGLDLSTVEGLEKATHSGPSVIAMDTIAKSKGTIPEPFLRGCGLSDWEIEQAKLYNLDLGNHEINEILYKVYDLRATQALQISNLFISYSHKDSEFVDKMEAKLDQMGVRNWRDIHDLKAGPMEKQINRAIRQNPTVLLVLSENSLESDWVQHEVRVARELSKELGRDILCPVALDSSWKNSSWPERIMEQIMEYNIVNFSEWKDQDIFENTFHKLIDGLELFYKG